MKKLFFSLFLCISTISFAQEFSVKQFFLAETDLTANTPGTMVEDQNGNPCALIKVETTLDGYTFNVGVLGVKETKRVGGEIWVYVPFGVKKITIGHPKLGTIRDYPFPCKIDKGRTYILKLNAKLGGRTYDTSKKQKMVLNIYPKSASVEINNAPIPLDNGKYNSVFSFGIYDLTVSAPRYHTLRKQVEINDLENAVNVDICLKQKFGWLQIPGEGDEKLWINGEQRTFVSDGKIDLDSGHHLIRMTKPLHEPFETTVEIKDSVVNRIIPNFIVRYREMEFNVAENAEIWINGRHFGNGYWKGRLEYGQYRIECKKSRHVSSFLDLKIEPNTIEQMTLETPSPTFREITFNVDKNAEIWVDNRHVGNGFWKDKIDYGQHIIECKKANHRPSKLDLNVRPNTMQQITLESPEPIYGYLSVTSSPSGADIYIDGVKAGVTPQTLPVIIGEHLVEVKKTDFSSQSQTFTILENDTQTFKTTLDNIIGVNISSTPNGLITLDGKHYKSNPLHKDVTLGKHKLKISAPYGYKNLKKTINVTNTDTDFDYSLKEKKVDGIEDLYDYGNMLVGYCGASDFQNLQHGCHVDFYSFKVYFGLDLLFRTKEAPFLMNIKCGYGIPISYRLLLTPSIGYARESYKERKSESNEFINNRPSITHIWNGVSGNCKLTASISNHWSIFIEPQFRYMHYKKYKHSNNMLDLPSNEESPKIDLRWNGKFIMNLNFGVSFNYSWD